VATLSYGDIVPHTDTERIFIFIIFAMATGWAVCDTTSILSHLIYYMVTTLSYWDMMHMDTERIFREHSGNM
jgi:hypothetical protein